MVSDRIIIWEAPRTPCGSKVGFEFSRTKELLTENYFSPPHKTNSIITKRQDSMHKNIWEREEGDSQKWYVHSDWEARLSNMAKAPLFGGPFFHFHFYLHITQWPLTQLMSNISNWSQHTNTQALTRCLCSKLTQCYQVFSFYITDIGLGPAPNIRFPRTQPLAAKLMLLPSAPFFFFYKLFLGFDSYILVFVHNPTAEDGSWRVSGKKGRTIGYRLLI